MNWLNRLIEPFLKAYIHNRSHKCKPDYDCDIQSSLVEEEVEIIRDKWAVPHIYAKNEKDMFFAQGFVHAQDRMWQMEVTRRAANGELSAVFGADALGVDKLSRRLGFKRLAITDLEQLQKHPLFDLMTSYVNGVNHYLSQTTHRAVEFTLTKIKPRKWTLLDTLSIGRLLAMQMTSGWLYEIERFMMYQQYGSEKMEQLFPSYPTGNPTNITELETNFRDIDGLMKTFNGPYFNVQSGSNNWVVSNERSEDGANYLCNDPHLLINTPNIWYENHLINPNYEVTGVSMAGIPMVMIGHNDRISWGATLTYADIQDTYIETFTDDSCQTYIVKGEERTTQILEEVIEVKGGRDHIEQVLITEHGPVVVDIDARHKIALRSHGLEENEMIRSFYDLNCARGWNDFVSACELMIFPSLNLVYADIESNIGYYMTGKVPIREREKEAIPTDGATHPNEWISTVPFEKMPHSFNPINGYFYTCNHKIVTDQYPYFLGNIWMNGYRAKTLDTYLKANDKYSIEDFIAWQNDFHCQAGLEFTAAVQKSIDLFHVKRTIEINVLLDIWSEWDGLLDEKSVAGAVYHVFKDELYRLLFKGDHRLQGHVGHRQLPLFTHSEFFGHDSCLLIKLLSQPNNPWWDKDGARFISLAFHNCYSSLVKRFGNDTSNWNWGELHQMVAMHGMSVKEPLGAIFNTGHFPIGGDTDTLCQIAHSPDKPFSGSMVGASYRQIINMQDLDASICISPVGQSGHVSSQHYCDQQELWKEGKYKKMLWSRDRVLQNKGYSMKIKFS